MKEERFVQTPDMPLSPWGRAMRRILTGLILEGLTLNVLGLDILLPVWGHILFLLGLRTLRRENSAFSVCWHIFLVQTALWAFRLLRQAALGWEFFNTSLPGRILLCLGLALEAAQLLCLRQGLRIVRSGTGLSPGGGGLTALLVWQILLTLLALLGGSSVQFGWPGFLVLLAVYACIFRSLRRSYREADAAGFVLRPVPVRIADWPLAGVVAGALLAGIAVVGLTCSRLPMEWQTVNPAAQDQAEEVKGQLLALGFPEEVLNDLSAEDIQACAGAVQVVSNAQDHTPANRSTDQTASEPLYLTGVAVKLAGEREKWRIFHHFQWENGTRFYGSDAIQLWPAYHSDGWFFSSRFTGQVLCEQNGTDFQSPYYFLGEEAYTSDGFFFGSQVSTDCFASFSFPRRGERCRGYVAYEAEALRPGYLLDSWANYAHAVNMFQYPALSAQEWIKTRNIFSNQEPFFLVQNALQFYPEQG